VRFFLGGYTAEQGGTATGIGVLIAGAADDALAGGGLGRGPNAVATAGSPSWVSPHPTLDVLYAALEGAGALQAFRRVGEASFAPLGRPVTVGDAPCHVAVAPDGGSLVVSCWGDGGVVRLGLDAGGTPSRPIAAASASDPYGASASAALGSPAAHGSAAASGSPAGLGMPAAYGMPDAHGSPAAHGTAGDLDLAAAARALRAAAGAEYAHLVPEFAESRAEPRGASPAVPERPSHAHQARYLPGRLIATTDMGLDLVRFWRDGGEGLRLVQEVALPRGSGPRHTVWHPSGHLLVVTELSHELFALAPDPSGAWRLVGGAPLTVAALDGDAAAEVALSRDAEFVYAGLRGTDTIAVLRVRGTGAEFAPVALVESGVTWPRHHVVERDTLLVAGQHSHEVVSLALDPRTGVPGRVRHRVEAPSPTCLVPDRR